MRGTVTRKDSLDSFVPPVWSVCHLSGAVLGLILGEDELLTRVKDMGLSIEIFLLDFPCMAETKKSPKGGLNQLCLCH